MSVPGPMAGVPRSTVAPAHHQVANVHDDCILQGRDIDKFAGFVRILNLDAISSLGVNPNKATDLLEDPRNHLGTPW